MKISSRELYAILTGDVVASSKMAPTDRRALPVKLRRASASLRKAFSKAVPLDADIFRGDSWQVLVTEPALGLRAALYFRASIVASSSRVPRIDTRVAVALGRIDFVPAKRVSEGDGEAYRLSGQALDAMPESQRMSFTRTGDDRENHGVVVRLLDALVQGWTPAQARAVLGRLQGWTQTEIAHLWPGSIAQQAVGRHLEKARWPAVESALRRIEENLERL